MRAGRLVEIPEGFILLAPTRIGPLLTTPLFSPIGKLRMALEPLVPVRRASEDESLASFVSRRLGREVLDRVVQPLIGGIYAADPESLSLKATMPRFIEMEQRYGSLIRGLKAAMKSRAAQSGASADARRSPFLTFRGGMKTIVAALVPHLAGCVRTDARVAAIERGPGARWRLTIDGGDSLDADGVVVAAPAYSAAKILAAPNPSLARLLEAIDYAPAAVVNMAFRTSDFPNPPRSFGFVVPAAEHRSIIAATFSSLKFPDRAPEGSILTRAFLGGVLKADMIRLDDAAMISAVREEFRSALGLKADPQLAHVQRWPKAMPQYRVGHVERVEEIERETLKMPAIALAGAAYRGIGVPDCIHSGEQAAERVFSALMPPV